MQIIANKLKANCILLDQSNKYCYGTSLGGDVIMVWRFDPATGTYRQKGAGEAHTKTRLAASASAIPP
jgi:hypothetical protein